MDFIFMLTRDDRTVEDCLEVVDDVLELGLRHVGFKDIGVAPATLRTLHRRIKEAGATSYLEVVNTTPEQALRSAAFAAEIKVDQLLGGTDADAVLRILKGSGIAYSPFPGFPQGHPTRLAGTASDIAAHCAAFRDKGCAGVDLLAYRATQAQPLELVAAARHALGKAGKVIVAGSVNTPERIQALRAGGVDAFTIGSAVFDGSFAPRQGGIRAQLRAVLDACEASSSAVA
jgi:hypothetical protein